MQLSTKEDTVYHVIEFQVIDTDVIPVLALQKPLTFS